MILTTFAFVAGVLLLQQQPELPTPVIGLLLPLFPVLLFRFRRRRWALVPVAFGCGFTWAALIAHMSLAAPLPEELEGKDVLVIGVVDSLPETVPGRTRFRLRVEQLQVGDKQWVAPGVVLVSWYRKAPQVLGGDRWQLQLRLKRPHGLSNPGGSDYERFLYRQGIWATGYVRQGTQSRRLDWVGWRYSFLNQRQQLGSRIDQVLASSPASSLLRALAIGDRSRLSAQDWQLLRRTGTNHLVAISGLHIGIVATLGLLLGNRIWRLSARLCQWLPAQQAGALVALLLGVGYAGFAGFAIPCQRALVMLVVMLGGVVLRRDISPTRTLCVALLSVLLIDPLAVLSPGFWLSFGAVAIIITSLFAGGPGKRSYLGLLVRTQCVVSLGLAPLLLLFGFEVSALAPLVNLIAVPLFSLLLVPLVLVSLLLLWMVPAWGALLLESVAWLVEQFLVGLLWLSKGVDWPLDLALQMPLWGYWGLMLMVVCLLMPAGWPGRWSGLLLLLPIALYRAPHPPQGAVWMTALDVGQGLAVVVRTKNHTLLYDTGPRYPSGFDTGARVVVPYLRSAGISHIDQIIVSNGDMDHRGGLAAVLQAFSYGRLLSGEPKRITAGRALSCTSGEQWTWDGVQFELLHPGQNKKWSGNDASCVLRVRAAGRHLLLTGDIEQAAERELLKSEHWRLAADVVTVPHHGSASSSSLAFVRALAPDVGIISAGYRNRYGFPRAEVTARWAQAGTRLWNTASSGAITLRLTAEGELQGPFAHRQSERRYWMHPYEEIEKPLTALDAGIEYSMIPAD